jgi:hypothetical protein
VIFATDLVSFQPSGPSKRSQTRPYDFSKWGKIDLPSDRDDEVIEMAQVSREEFKELEARVARLEDKIK